MTKAKEKTFISYEVTVSHSLTDRRNAAERVETILNNMDETRAASVEEMRKYIPIDDPCIHAEKSTDKTTYLFFVRKKTTARTITDADGNSGEILKGDAEVLYKVAVHDFHKANRPRPVSYMATLHEKYFNLPIYLDLVFFGYTTAQRCAAHFIAWKLQTQIIDPYINTLPETEARLMLTKLFRFTKQKILNSQQIKGNTPEKFFELLDGKISRFINTKDGELPSCEQNGVINVAQDVLTRAAAKNITPLEQAKQTIKGAIELSHLPVKPEDVCILGVTTTADEIACVDMIGALLFNAEHVTKSSDVFYCDIDYKPPYIEKNRITASITLDANDFLKCMGKEPTYWQRRRYYEVMDNLSKKRVLIVRNGAYTIAAPLMIRIDGELDDNPDSNNESTANETKPTTPPPPNKTERWTITVYSDLYGLPTTKSIPDTLTDYTKFKPQITRRAMSLMPNMQGTKANPAYDNIPNVIHNICADLATQPHICEKLSYYAYKEEDDDRDHKALAILKQAFRVDEVPNDIQFFRKTRKEKNDEGKEICIKELYITGGFATTQDEISKLQNQTSQNK